MIHAPFEPQVGGAMLALLAQFAIVVAGFAIMLNARRIAGRVFLLGLFLAVMAGVVPGWLR